MSYVAGFSIMADLSLLLLSNFRLISHKAKSKVILPLLSHAFEYYTRAQTPFLRQSFLRAHSDILNDEVNMRIKFRRAECRLGTIPGGILSFTLQKFRTETSTHTT